MLSVAIVTAAVTNGRQTEGVFVPAAISWWAVGSALYGMESCNGNPFLGTQHFFSFGNVSSEKHYFALWVFGWAFSATAATIVSGAVAERMQFRLAGRSPSLEHGLGMQQNLQMHCLTLHPAFALQGLPHFDVFHGYLHLSYCCALGMVCQRLAVGIED
jgi:hypothetical protein